MTTSEPRHHDRLPGETWDEWITRLAKAEAAKAPKPRPEVLHRVAVLLGRRAA